MTPGPLLRVLERHVIYDTILDLCPITTVLRLKRVCRATNAAVTDYMGRLYDINRHLSHFFEDPKAFRANQARTGALIVGPEAHLYFQRFRIEYPRTKIVISVAGLDSIIELCQWLEKSGYEFDPPTHWKGLSYEERGVRRLHAETYAHRWSLNFEGTTQTTGACRRGLTRETQRLITTSSSFVNEGDLDSGLTLSNGVCVPV